MAEILDLQGFDDDERRYLAALAGGLKCSIEDVAGRILADIAKDHRNKVMERVVACEITNLALIRAKRGTEK